MIYQQNARLVNSHPRAYGVGATPRFPALPTRRHRVGAGEGLCLDQQVGSGLRAQAMRQGPDDQLGLVIDPLALPGRMQRNRQNHIRAEISPALATTPASCAANQPPSRVTCSCLNSVIVLTSARFRIAMSLVTEKI
jgi:hypothetical protein